MSKNNIEFLVCESSTWWFFSARRALLQFWGSEWIYITFLKRLCVCKLQYFIKKHIHETWAFLVKSGILRTSVYNVYGSQNEFVEHISQEYSFCACVVFGQNCPLSMEQHICGSENLYHLSQEILCLQVQKSIECWQNAYSFIKLERTKFTFKERNCL